MSRSDTVLWDQSVTFFHDNIKVKESWIILIYSNSKNLIPKWVWSGVMSPHRCANTVIDGVPNMVLLSMVHVFVACHLLSIVVDFILLFNIYWFLFWVGRWYLLNKCSLYWPLLVYSSCYFVECSKWTIDFDSPSTLVSLLHIRFLGELLFLARTGFSPSRLDVFEVRTWTIVLLILSY